MQRSESAPRRPYAVPFRHPHWESPRDRQAREYRAEVRAFMAKADAQRQRLASARVLEAGR